MTRFEIVQYAGEHETFAPQAFDGSIGKTVPLNVEGRGAGEATLVSAVVADDGKSATLTFELDGPEDLLDPSPIGEFSIGRQL